MKEDIRTKPEKGLIRDAAFLGIILIGAILLLSVFPDKREAAIHKSWEFLVEMIWILPAVMVLVGLFTVWVSKEMVVRYLGETSGAKGIALAILFGALPTGPLYAAFPMAAGLLNKGARISNIVIFLSAWGCIKIPQEMVELRFLGPQFMISRLLLTVIFVVVMGISLERFIKWSDTRAKNS